MSEERDLGVRDHLVEGAKPAESESGCALNGEGERSTGSPEPVEDRLRSYQEEEREVVYDGVRLPQLLGGAARTRRLVRKEEAQGRAPLTAEQRLMLLDTWRRSRLPATDFGAMVGLTSHTLYEWKKRFTAAGPAGLTDRQRGTGAGSRLPEVTRRAVLMLKEDNPEWGCQRISDVLARGPGLGASAGAVARVLHEAGYELEEVPTHGHPEQVRSFERSAANQLWQTDLFTFLLKRQNRRVHLVGYGLHATASAAMVIEVLRAAIANYQAPMELLTDNGSQYVTWRGKSAFTRECEARGIRQIVSSPRRPQTLGKIERFWGTLWRECVGTAVFLDLEDARRRIGHFIDYYNFQRPHQGIEGLVPADRYFRAAPEVLKVLKERVAANAADMARNGIPREPFYLTGQVGGKAFSVHAEGERVILTREAGERKEIELVGPPEERRRAAPPPEPLCPQGVVEGYEGMEEPDAPGMSALDDLTGGRP